jgi:undecaprenyl-diphosphatase
VASLLVILLFFKKEITEIVRQPFIKKKSDKKNWWLYIILSTAMTVLIAGILYDKIDNFRTVYSVADWLLITTFLLLATKFVVGPNQKINWKVALVLGLVQGFAVIPGLSRSGVVIATALILKIKKRDAFDYAFILAIPAILGSFILTVQDFAFQWLYLVGFVVTMFVGYWTLYLLKMVINKNYFYLFFLYTAILSIIINFI